MNPRRLVGASLSGLLWSVVGTDLLNGFGIDGVAAPQLALGILVAAMAVVAYRYEDNVGMQIALVLVAALGFFTGFVLYFALSPGL